MIKYADDTGRCIGANANQNIEISIKAMNADNFQLGSVFHNNAKLYTTRPVMAMKYQPGLGIENGFCVHYSSAETFTREYMMYEGIRFFPSEADAWEFINRSEKQYVKVNGILTEIEAVYDNPEPVLYRKDANAEELDGIHFCFGKHAFISDESEDYEFYILDSNCENDVWIIQDMLSGNIRVWDNASDELFFGKKSEYVFEKNDKGEYRQAAM